MKDFWLTNYAASGQVPLFVLKVCSVGYSNYWVWLHNGFWPRLLRMDMYHGCILPGFDAHIRHLCKYVLLYPWICNLFLYKILSRLFWFQGTYNLSLCKTRLVSIHNPLIHTYWRYWISLWNSQLKNSELWHGTPKNLDAMLLLLWRLVYLVVKMNELWCLIFCGIF